MADTDERPAVPLRLLVVGIGATVWALHRPAIAATGAEVVAVHDVDPERARRAAAEIGCEAVPDLADLLVREADVAVVLAPHAWHAELASACLRAGYDVLLEKPIATTPEEADVLVDLADETGRRLAIALQQRTRSEVAEAKRLIDSGALGELERLDLIAAWPRRSSYFREVGWRGTWIGESGGVLLNQGHHDIDLLCHLGGMPIAVTGRTRTRIQPIEVEDTAVGLLEWAGGALGTLRVTTAVADVPQRIEIAGTAGRLRLLPGRLDHWQLGSDFREWAGSPGDPYEPPLVERLAPLQGDGGTHTEIYRNLADALAGRATAVAPASDACAAVELAAATVLSAQRSTRVELPVNRGEYGNLLAELRGEDVSETWDAIER